MARAKHSAAVLVLIGALAACGPGGDGAASRNSTTTTAHSAEGWEQLPEAPLSPRAEAVLVTLDDGRLLVVGGDSHPGCHDTIPLRDSPSAAPPSPASAYPRVEHVSTADCAGPGKETRLRDGAILNSAGEWTVIAEAPVPLSQPSGEVVIAESVYFSSPTRHFGFEKKSDPAWVSFDVAANSWRRLPHPMAGERPPDGLVRAGERVIAFHTSDEQGELPDFIYDPAAGEWSELPDDPLPASFDRMMAWTGSGVGVLGREIAALNQPNGPPLRGAVFDLATERWRPLDAEDVSHSNVTWEWALARVVNASAVGEDPASGSALPPVPSIPRTCDDVHRPDQPADGESSIGDLQLGDWTLNVPPETNGTTSCNPRLADDAVSSAWALDGVVAFGGYDVVAEPGELPTDYKFSNDTWRWRPPE